MKLSDSMGGLLAMIRIDGYVSWPVRGSTYRALERRGLVEGPFPHPVPQLADTGWQIARLTAAGAKFLDDKGVAPTQIRCPHCRGSGRIPPNNGVKA
jgi:hypothetical protein